MASCLPVKEIMNDTCQHCGELIVGNAYRVTSEDQGIPLLDMVVCSLCFMEAKRLHLHAEEINLGSKQASPRNRESHRPRLGI
jgi:RNase P subunit RPR2